MPALNHPHPHTETLANGLRISLRHAPSLKRCAAFLRVAAGSHDVPLAWPGLAHFLEHLLFLGTERFPADQALMAYVQAQGGQVNASTRERHTDFFFELPPASFNAGLERLSDMLAHPRMNQHDQQREIEVLHAEFIAWSQDAAAQQAQALFDGLSSAHPLRGFHAGNRETLPVANAAFQQALADFHQRFYQAGHMTLYLVGPQALEELHALAKSFADVLRVGQPQPQAATVRLMAHGSRYRQVHPQRLDLLHALEDLSDHSAQALGFICHWLNNRKPGGLTDRLRELNLADTLKASVLYQFAGQALLHIAIQRKSDEQDEAIAQHVADWLSFFSTQAPWSGLREEYAALRQRQQQVSGALQLARGDADHAAEPLTEQGVRALQQILGQLGATLQFSAAWQLPAHNPFLQPADAEPSAGLIRGQTSAHRGLRTFAQDRTRGRRERSPMQFSRALPESGEQGAVYLRWQLTRPEAQLHGRLDHALSDIRDDARQAGVEISFSEYGSQWLLKLVGLQQPLPVVLEQVLQRLGTSIASAVEPPATPTLIPIRQLLNALPAACMGPEGSLTDAAFAWETAHWDGLAIGLSPGTHTALTRALSRAPGIPGGEFPPIPTINGQRLWHHLPSDSSEQALLLFCPAPSLDLVDEAAWRLLASLCQTPFYQRLRVELQLGYAVFSGVRQYHGQTGLLFGVQSPSADTTALMAHVEDFLLQLPAVLLTIDARTFDQQRHALAEHMQLSEQPLPEAAERLWQGKWAGHSSDELVRLPAAIEVLDAYAVQRAARQLLEGTGGWRCLASGACPDAHWQARE